MDARDEKKQRLKISPLLLFQLVTQNPLTVACTVCYHLTDLCMSLGNSMVI